MRLRVLDEAGGCDVDILWELRVHKEASRVLCIRGAGVEGGRGCVEDSFVARRAAACGGGIRCDPGGTRGCGITVDSDGAVVVAQWIKVELWYGPVLRGEAVEREEGEGGGCLSHDRLRDWPESLAISMTERRRSARMVGVAGMSKIGPALGGLRGCLTK